MTEVERLKNVLRRFYELYKDGTSYYYEVGQAVKLPYDLEQQVLNLIVDHAEKYDPSCIRCGNPYSAHYWFNRRKSK